MFFLIEEGVEKITLITFKNPAIRDRHWQQLVTATRVSFIMSEDTSLADLVRYYSEYGIFYKEK